MQNRPSSAVVALATVVQIALGGVHLASAEPVPSRPAALPQSAHTGSAFDEAVRRHRMEIRQGATRPTQGLPAGTPSQGPLERHRDRLARSEARLREFASTNGNNAGVSRPLERRPGDSIGSPLLEEVRERRARYGAALAESLQEVPSADSMPSQAVEGGREVAADAMPNGPRAGKARAGSTAAADPGSVPPVPGRSAGPLILSRSNSVPVIAAGAKHPSGRGVENFRDESRLTPKEEAVRDGILKNLTEIAYGRLMGPAVGRAVGRLFAIMDLLEPIELGRPEDAELRYKTRMFLDHLDAEAVELERLRRAYTREPQGESDVRGDRDNPRRRE